MSDDAPIDETWQRAGAELVAVLEEQIGGAALIVRERSAVISDLSARLLIARSRGEHVRAQAIENSIFLNLAMLAEIERSRMQEIFEKAVWIAARLVRAAIGVPA